MKTIIKLSPYEVQIPRLHMNYVYTKPRLTLEHIQAKVQTVRTIIQQRATLQITHVLDLLHGLYPV